MLLSYYIILLSLKSVLHWYIYANIQLHIRFSKVEVKKDRKKTEMKEKVHFNLLRLIRMLRIVSKNFGNMFVSIIKSKQFYYLILFKYQFISMIVEAKQIWDSPLA